MTNDKPLDAIEAFQEGHTAGQSVSLELINKYCNTKFENLSEAINHINNSHELIEELGGTVDGVFKEPEVAPEQTIKDLEVISKSEVQEAEPATIEFDCIVYKRGKFNFEFNYGVGHLKITPTLVQITSSPTRFPARDSTEIMLWKEDILDVIQDGLHLHFKIKGEGAYTLRTNNYADLANAFSMLAGNKSEEEAQEQADVENMIGIIFSSQSTAWVTSLIVAICTSIFVLMCIQGYGVLSPNSFMAIQWGSKFTPLIYDGEYWRLITNGFLHLGIIHLALNMYILHQAGYYFERIYGSIHFLALYIYCLVFSTIVSAWWSPQQNSLGASGAIFGLFAAITTYAFFNKNKIPRSISKELIKDGFIFFAINISIGFSVSMVDNAAHIGGIVGGVLFGLIFARPISENRSNHIDYSFAAKLFVGLIILFLSWHFLISENQNLIKKLDVTRTSYYFETARTEYEKKNYDKALKYAHIAADQGSKSAPGLLGYMYKKGEGTKENLFKSKYWNQIGMDRGDAYATYNLAISYTSGQDENKTTAYELFAKSAELGSMMGKYAVTDQLIIGGFGLEANTGLADTYLKDMAKDNSSLTYIKENVEKNNPKSQYYLGKFYQNGYSVNKDDKTAYKLFLDSAEQGFSLSQYEIGMIMLNGIGIDKDKDKAKNWLMKSFENGYKPAKKVITQLN
jgi:membrane associated rhomboid family serine protease/TPR repeat protein